MVIPFSYFIISRSFTIFVADLRKNVMKENFEVDLVYTWVDGNDPAWQKKHATFTGKKPVGADVDCKGRYADNDELKYSLRSVEKYAPWIRHTYS